MGRGCTGRPKGCAEIQDVADTKLPNDSVDIVSAVEFCTICHDGNVHVLKEAHRILKPGVIFS